MAKLKSVAIIGGGKKENRNDHDFYPTPYEVTEALLRYLYDNAILYGKRHVWEPCCGEGGISNVLIKHGHIVYSTDLRQSGYGKGGVNYITHTGVGPFDMVITNPPFNIAKEIIEKALGDAPIVCMLLKATYWHPQDRISLFKNNPPALVLPLTWRPDFNGGGNPTMDLIWNVWIDGIKETKYDILLRPENEQQLAIF